MRQDLRALSKQAVLIKVHKVAIAMFGTIDVIRQVKDWGADFLINARTAL